MRGAPRPAPCAAAPRDGLDGGGVLADRHAVAYTPGATALVYALRNRPGTGRAAKRSVYVAGTSSLADAHLEFFEADSALFDAGPWEVTSDFGPAATPDRAREQLGRSDVAHITCHGYFDSQRPLRSGLLLASGRSRPPRDLRQLPILERRDYVLTAQDLLRTPIRTDLLMLRACSTGLQGSGTGRNHARVASSALGSNPNPPDQRRSRTRTRTGAGAPTGLATNAHAAHGRRISSPVARGANWRSGSRKHQSGHDGIDANTAAPGAASDACTAAS